MICVSEFLTTLFKKILEKPVAADKYVVKYNISRNNFVYYINSNHKMSQPVAHGLYRIVMDTIKESPEKESTIMNYFSSLSTVKEKDHLPGPEIIKACIAKFTATSTRPKKKIKVLGYQDIQEANINIRDVIIDMMKLNFEEMEGLTPEHGGEVDQWSTLAKNCKETWRCLYNGDKLIGVWSFEPLFDDAFQKAKNGELFDVDINLDIIPVLVPGTYNIYFIEICMDTAYKGTSIFRIMLNSIAQVFENLASKEIFFNEICTQAYTTDGERLCKSLGLKYHKKHVDSGNIYCGSIKELLEQPFCRNFYTLKKLYKY